MKLFIKNFFALLGLALLPALAFSQRTISGTVTDASNGETLIGASILVVGTSTGTVSDIDGTYSLTVPEGSTALRLSYTGYEPVEVQLGASNTVDIAMNPGTLLSEIVVIGYGEVKKEDATGSVTEVNSEVFNRGAITAPQELLAGKVAGVQITPSSDPGGGAQIRIRGGSSLSASNDPLIVIDGIPLDNKGISGARNIFDFVNPNDIETFTVLKDASATAIYGSRASNGVIIITTKKGKLGQKVKVEYNGNVSFSNALQAADVLNASEYTDLIKARFPDSHPSRTLLGTADTDWQDAIYETGVGHDHNLNFTGGIGFVPYRVSVGYTDKKGILKTDHYQRTTASINLSPRLIDNRLQVNFSLKGMNTDNRFANRGAIGAASSFDPTQSIRVDNGPYGGYFTWLQPNGEPNTLAAANPLAQLNLRNDESNVKRFVVSSSFDYRFGFLPELRANLNLAYDRSNGEGNVDVPAAASFAFFDGGVKNTYSQTKENSLLEFYLNYVKEMGQTKLDVMGGYSWQRNYFTDDFKNSNIAGTETSDGDNSGELFLLSLFGRVNLTFFDRLLLTGTVRRDGSSRFSEDSRWGVFPAAALGFKVFDNNGKGTISSLKVRLGWGVTGQQEIGDYYVHLPRYLASFENAGYQFGDTFVQTLRPGGYDSKIKWEETTTKNIGVDYGFMDERIYGSIEYYERNTKDLLNFIPVAAGSNLTNFINTNIGDLENKGVEFSINLNPLRSEKMNWDFGFNITANKNKITKLTASDDPSYKGVLTGNISGGVGNTAQIHSVGFPANSFYVYEQVYDNNGIPIEGLYVDRNGDGLVNNEDKYRLEKSAPDYFLGFTSTFNYGKFDFSFAGRANFGNFVYNNVQSGSSYAKLYQPTGYLENVNTISSKLDFQNPQYLSDYFVQDASFLRLDHVTVGYNFGSMLEKIDFLKLFATVQNPLLITDYKGIDPEIDSGIDNNFYPRSRTILFGLNARF
ncbi:MAG: SusC/RagA family TonB-linked outer membrane protein [Saprospiraceae bacterium]|nr:SusC/RagA family TonB-linked outer membrane protein [Saprospiraceae bacterium]MCF8248503.1 SusC/RagA family TonB-linked outer membrane protein [Saprospiraceae bacterium]MCF8280574.1 SusC/RagA family TonB-linked outer membrane protein [Bacteroidales bacterium]MCF8310237.1 SusC/RagA family TonB-linked outer membrane protein [Saprospiraceae bacterium]MCF8439324.1 SusC/RagA family TonB-linked outer membrane protein [Saprospiraceae bacterium]